MDICAAFDEITELEYLARERERMEEEHGHEERLVWVEGVGAVPVSMLTDEDHAAGITRIPPRSEVEREIRNRLRCRVCRRTPDEASADDDALDEIYILEWREIIKAHASRCPECGHFEM